MTAQPITDDIQSLCAELATITAERDALRIQLNSTQWSHDVQSDAADRAEAERNVALVELATVKIERDTARADAERLAMAIGGIEKSNGYRLDVPDWYDDRQDWIVTAGAIRYCKVALDAHRQATQ